MLMEAPGFIMYVAGPIELVGGFLVMAGFMNRWGAFLCSWLMAVAYRMAHGSKAVFPLENGGELAVLSCVVLLFVSAQGPGVWSVDEAKGKT